MGRKMLPAYGFGTVPETESGEYVTGQTYKKGAVLAFNANGQVQEHAGGAVVTGIAGVAAEGAASKPGWDAANSPSVVTGRLQETSYWKANRSTIFSMRGVNGGTDPLTPTQTMVDERFGMIKTGEDWVLDQADTTDVVLEVVRVDIDNKIFFAKFIESSLALP